MNLRENCFGSIVMSMAHSSHPAEPLPPALLERVLERLGFSFAPLPTATWLRELYGAWCQRVPFDNIRKLIHLAHGEPGPFPGSDAVDFFEAWLRHGTGSTCWGGHGALHALLCALGFVARRGYATMLLAPDIPPNHATVVVDLDDRRWLVDASIMHGEPLELASSASTRVDHGAWGAQATRRDGMHWIRFRPIHMPEGLDCRIDRIDVSARTFHEFHQGTRAWSPFNFELYARINRGDTVVGTGFGERFLFAADGSVARAPLETHERTAFLVDVLGIDEALAARLPADRPTPPPPGSGARAAKSDA